MIDTVDLPSYISGYDDYCEKIERENEPVIERDYDTEYDEIKMNKMED